MKSVQGRDNLVKLDTGAVVNVDHNSYQLAKNHKKRLLKEREKQKELEDRIVKLEALIEKLLEDKEDE